MQQLIKLINNKTVFHVASSKALFFCMFLSSCAFGFTSIAIVGDKQRIVVASDTLVSTTLGENMGSRRSHGCKIGISKGLVVMRAGLADDRRRGFYPEKIAFQIFSQPGSVQVRAKRFAEAIERPLLKSLKIFQMTNAATYKAVLGEVALQVAVIEIHNGAPVLTIVAFGKEESLAGIPVAIKTKLSFCPSVACGQDYLWQLGSNKAIQRIKQTKGSRLTGGPVAIAKQMIEFEIIAEPEGVGPPIDILEVTAKGPRWLEQHVCK